MCKEGCCDCKELSSRLNRIEDLYNKLWKSAGPLAEGNPILMLQKSSDINSFDITTGKGSGVWANYAMCDGRTHGTGLNAVATPDLRDRFVVGSGNTYTVNNIGGSATVTLTVPELPVVTPSVTDPGHTHVATQAAHNHSVTDAGHTHVGTQAPHNHSLTITGGGHSHGVVVDYDAGYDDAGSGGNVVLAESDGPDQHTFTTSGDGAHTHTGSTDSSTPVISVASATTGLSIDNEQPAITVSTEQSGVTVASFGGGLPHENRPPYYSVLFVMRVA
jgi:microcystin-dependent protein